MHAIDTPRLHLRPLAERDGALYCSLYTDPEVMRYIAAPLSPEAAQRSFVAACRLQWPHPQRWVISERGAGGAIGLLSMSVDGEAAEVGVMLLAEAQGQGYAAEAIAALADVVFDGSGPDRREILRLWVRHAPGNRPMSEVMHRLGFQREDMPPMDQLRWQLTRARWQALGERGEDVAMSREDR